jgi:hypothetical protein
MPNWTNRPTAAQQKSHLRLVRTPAKGKHGGIVLSADLIGCETHFYRNRTTPCSAPDCPACRAGYPTRWHAWIAVWTRKTNETLIFEMTAAVAEPFAGYHDHYGTLHGAEFYAERPSATPNGRVRVRIWPADLAGITLPPCPDVVAQLTHIWSIPKPDVSRQPLPGGNGELRTALNDVLRTSDPTLRSTTGQKSP